MCLFFSSDTPFNQNYSRPCNESWRQSHTNGYVPEAQLQFVSDAVMAFAVALRVRFITRNTNTLTTKGCYQIILFNVIYFAA